MVRGHAGTTVIIQRNVRDNTLSFIDRGRLIKLIPVDLINNARDRRARNNAEVDEPPQNHNKSSADIAFSQDVLPIVDADGGFTGQKENNNE